MNSTPHTQQWGVNIEPGARVTTRGRDGAGQPAITGTVERVERDTVIIRGAKGVVRRRSIRNVRRADES